MSGSQVGIEELGQLFSKSLYFPVRGTLLEVSDLQLCSAACCTVWTVPNGEREEAGWEWASIYYQDTHMSTGKTWGSPEFIPVSTTSSILGEKKIQSFKDFQKQRIPYCCCNVPPTIYLPYS